MATAADIITAWRKQPSPTYSSLKQTAVVAEPRTQVYKAPVPASKLKTEVMRKESERRAAALMSRIQQKKDIVKQKEKQLQKAREAVTLQSALKGKAKEVSEKRAKVLMARVEKKKKELEVKKEDKKVSVLAAPPKKPEAPRAIVRPERDFIQMVEAPYEPTTVETLREKADVPQLAPVVLPAPELVEAPKAPKPPKSFVQLTDRPYGEAQREDKFVKMAEAPYGDVQKVAISELPKKKTAMQRFLMTSEEREKAGIAKEAPLLTAIGLKPPESLKTVVLRDDERVSSKDIVAQAGKVQVRGFTGKEYLYLGKVAGTGLVAGATLFSGGSVPGAVKLAGLYGRGVIGTAAGTKTAISIAKRKAPLRQQQIMETPVFMESFKGATHDETRAYGIDEEKVEAARMHQDLEVKRAREAGFTEEEAQFMGAEAFKEKSKIGTWTGIWKPFVGEFPATRLISGVGEEDVFIKSFQERYLQAGGREEDLEVATEAALRRRKSGEIGAGVGLLGVSTAADLIGTKFVTQGLHKAGIEVTKKGLLTTTGKVLEKPGRKVFKAAAIGIGKAGVLEGVGGETAMQIGRGEDINVGRILGMGALGGAIAAPLGGAISAFGIKGAVPALAKSTETVGKKVAKKVVETPAKARYTIGSRGLLAGARIGDLYEFPADKLSELIMWTGRKIGKRVVRKPPIKVRVPTPTGVTFFSSTKEPLVFREGVIKPAPTPPTPQPTPVDITLGKSPVSITEEIPQDVPPIVPDPVTDPTPTPTNGGKTPTPVDIIPEVPPSEETPTDTPTETETPIESLTPVVTPTKFAGFFPFGGFPGMGGKGYGLGAFGSGVVVTNPIKDLPEEWRQRMIARGPYKAWNIPGYTTPKQKAQKAVTKMFGNVRKMDMMPRGTTKSIKGLI